MKIFFTCTTSDFNKHKKDYYRIRNYIVEQGHILTRDWLKPTEARIKKGFDDVPDIKSIYDSVINAVYDADLLIVEDTVSNFSTGHQITLALSRNIPTLVLWKVGKHKHFKSMFIHGVESDCLEIEEYSDKNLEKTINRFINKYEDKEQKNRFHLVLNNVERKYLDWAHFNKGESRTKLIRKALRNVINNDEEYKKYLEV